MNTDLARSAGESIRISVVVPARNEEQLLPSCLDSLKHQTFSLPYEVIVVDNASRDRTADVAREMGARVVTEPHPGITWARQKGLGAAQGDIVAYVDADSTVEPGWLERIWTAFCRDRRLSAVSGPVFYSQGRTWRGKLYRWTTGITLFGDKTLRFVCRKRGTLWGANFAVWKSALVAAGGFNKNLVFYGEDTEMSLRLRKVGRIHFDRKNTVQTSPRRFERGQVLATSWLILSTFIRLVVTDGRAACPERRGKRPRRFVSVTVSAALLLVGFLGGLTYMAFSPSSQVYGQVYVGGPADREKLIALSFDDGPNEPYTSQVLKILDDNGIKATFFVTGKNAEVFPETVKEIVRRGHILGNHTYSHSYRVPFERFGGIREEVDRTEDIIFGLTGLRTDLFRPPHGLRTPWFIKDIKELNYKVVTWTDMTNDYDLKTSAEEIVRRIISKARPGGIIDLHDGKDLSHGIDRSNMVRALPVIIGRLKNEGYRFVTLPVLLRVAPYKTRA
jgi:peptidoglycan/xylan/chitin deacetylase (PgdA/CDA1 family)